MGIFAIIVGVVGIIVLSTFIRGFVLTYLWEWFVVPFGLPELGLAHAIGISMIVGYLTYQHTSSKEEDIASAIGTSLVGPFLVLLLGYIVHSFM